MSSERRVFNGVTYYRYPESKRSSDRDYFKRNGKTLQRAVWEAHHGPIPDGFEVHHKDTDPGNNDIDNLELIAKSDHIATYHGGPTEYRRRNIAKARISAAEWHGSEEGRAWHREHIADIRAKREDREMSCAHCGAIFTTKQFGGVSRYCSNKCKAAARRASGVDNIEVVCPHCGTTFTKDRYSKTRYCSRICARRARDG